MSILDQVRKNQFQDSISGFNPKEVLDSLFFKLSDKERDVIARRFGLVGDRRYTLEEIGKHYGITRERVRQIENLSIRKLRELEDYRDKIRDTEKIVAQLLEQYGGVMEESFFLENVLNYLEAQEDNANALLFLAEYIFSDNVSKIRQDREFNNLWKVSSTNIDSLKEVISEMVRVIEANQKPIILEELLTRFKNSDYYQANREKFLAATSFLEATEEDIDKILESYLRSSRKIKQNLFNEWGLVSWGTVQPKKINDKIYIVLKKAGKPLHFTEIANLINETKFDEKIAFPPTVHNELILDDKYVLVGRGIYALKEWGYKPGNVADVIVDVLKEKGPMTKDGIIEAVLDQRNVKKSTVYLSLMNSNKIKKNEQGKYALVGEENLAQDHSQIRQNY
ncbi:MAG TPA: sigma factor-like helix-turn-helix DNA-binding protein [bacterium]|nr:sigma factor-like helix-turn-helix DNA-binding protein [bacterium]HNS34188.1 sigma factor-like helix-turn-helix DNA-binding protein [bacterium]HNZ73467.1 sigma factor-like helix-turn-helix DNA-binding protein [bacterium]HOH67398.1 sigma factor-like helix-turn-helix DNA-binding protein [bacterium]HQA63921.1 sigma factor-like helix-turn-helix DNA-binding protein [bacterium]